MSIPRLARWLAAWLAAALLAGCASTRFTNTWKDPSFTGGRFQKIVVMGVSGEEGRRRTFEDIFSARLRAAGVDAVPGYSVIPETGMVPRERIDAAMRMAGADAVLVTRLVAIDRRTHFSPGYVSVVPAVGFYRDFYGFYSSAWTFQTPPQVQQFDVVTVETNLWSAKSQQLVWSGTTETFAPGEFQAEVRGFADLLVGALKEMNLI